MKKGFTLIELLAVIVILAIIALIASPIVIKLIEDSKQSSLERSAENIARTAENYYAQNLLNGIPVSAVSTNDLSFDGAKPEKGAVVFNNEGKSKLTIYDDGYCVTIDYDNTITTTKTTKDECKTNFTFYSTAGNVVYYDVIEGEYCNVTGKSMYHADNSKTGFNGVITGDSSTKTTDNQTSCLKFYTISEDTEGGKTLILDHNTKNKIRWVTPSEYDDPDTGDSTCEIYLCIDKGPVTALSQLGLDTAEWTAKTPTTYVDGVYGELSYEGYNARFLTQEEVFSITGVNKGTFDDNCWRSGTCSAGQNKYGWLFDNLEDCTNYGCNTSSTSNNLGYWLSTSPKPGNAGFRIKFTGSINGTNTHDESWYGVRPVIEI